jgi:hypothetical protein
LKATEGEQGRREDCCLLNLGATNTTNFTGGFEPAIALGADRLAVAPCFGQDLFPDDAS